MYGAVLFEKQGKKDNIIENLLKRAKHLEIWIFLDIFAMCHDCSYSKMYLH